MFADEGLGVHLCKQLEKNYKFTHSEFTLDFVDGGTLALQLSYIIARYDRLIVLDCIEAQGASIGDVFFFPYDAMPNKISWSGSAHEIEMLQTLQYMELAGDLPKTHILACVPKRIEAMSFKLSDELIQGAKIMEKTLLDFLSKVYEVEEDKITEEATHSWYADNEPLHPYDGKTNPNYTGLVDGESVDHHGNHVHSKVFDTKGKYSWIKAPRYEGNPMQVGPLANIVVNYAKGNQNVVPVVDEFLKETGLPLNAVFSTLGRTAARCIEAKIVANNALKAFNNLVENLKVDQSTCAPYVIDNSKEYKGRYMGHVPRGTLSHWCRIKNGVIENWQAVVPSTWNASPKDANGVGGSYEQCLIGLKIADVKQPLEIIRKIHSYDPCIACAVHVMDTKGNNLSEYKVNVNL